MLKDFPEWVLQHKTKNVEIRKIDENYYAYQIKSVWDKKKKRVKKVTQKYLGAIKKEGSIPSKHKRLVLIKLKCCL